MGNGTRTLLNADGVITDWVKQYFESVPLSLSAVANPKVTFDLLIPADNSRHGSPVQQGVQKLKRPGLEFPGTADSQAASKGPGLTGLSSLTAFRLSVVDVFQYALNYRDLTLGSGRGSATISNPTGQWLKLQVGWPGGGQGIYYQSGMSIIVNKWYVAYSVILPSRDHKLTLSDEAAIAASPTGYLTNVASNPLMLGVSAVGSSMLKGNTEFSGVWGNEFTAGDIATAITLGINTMTGKGQAV